MIKDYEIIDHIIIVDNCSPDGSYEKLKPLAGGDTDVIQTDANKGYSYGNNFGVNYLMQRYGADILFISNPDVEFPEVFLARVINDMEQYHVQAATGYMRTPTPFRENRSINTYWREVLDCTFFLKRIFPFKGERVLPGKGIVEVEWVPGSLFAIEAKVFEEIQGFDDSFFLYYEEQILGKKFQTAGYKMIVDTDIEYFHNWSVSINKSMKKISQLRQLYESKYHFYTKYEHIGPVKQLIMKAAMEYGILRRKIKGRFVA